MLTQYYGLQWRKNDQAIIYSSTSAFEMVHFWGKCQYDNECMIEEIEIDIGVKAYH